MTQTPPNVNDPNTPGGEPAPTPDPNADEESRRQRAAREKEAHDTKLENIMLRAGIDPDDPEAKMNKLFFDGYNGDLTNEAVIEAAKGYGLIKDPEAPPAPSGEITDPDERRQTLERQQAAGGAAPDGGAPSEDPRITAVKAGEEVMDAGGSQEAAMGAAFNHIAAAGFGSRADNRAPDVRAQWDPERPDPRRPDLGW